MTGQPSFETRVTNLLSANNPFSRKRIDDRPSEDPQEVRALRSERARVGHEERGLHCRTTWNYLGESTIASTLATWRRCSQPCTKMSFGQTAWKGAMSTGAKEYAVTGRGSGQWSIRTSSRLGLRRAQKEK